MGKMIRTSGSLIDDDVDSEVAFEDEPARVMIGDRVAEMASRMGVAMLSIFGKREGGIRAG